MISFKKLLSLSLVLGTVACINAMPEEPSTPRGEQPVRTLPEAPLTPRGQRPRMAYEEPGTPRRLVAMEMSTGRLPLRPIVVAERTRVAVARPAAVQPGAYTSTASALQRQRQAQAMMLKAGAVPARPAAAAAAKAEKPGAVRMGSAKEKEREMEEAEEGSQGRRSLESSMF